MSVLDAKIEKRLLHPTPESKLRALHSQTPIFNEIEDIKSIQPVIANEEAEVMHQIRQLQSVQATTEALTPSSMDIFIF